MERISESDVRIVQNIYSQAGRVEVYKVQQIRTGNFLCMKKIAVKDINEASQMQSEFVSMAELNGDGILKFISASFSGSGNQITHVIIFTEFCEEGDLQFFINNRVNYKQYFTEDELLAYLKQLVGTFSYMQAKGTCHRDIKPQNLFVFNKGKNIKVGDLGNAIKDNDYQGRSVAGTPLYLSPKLRECYSSGGGMFGVNHNVYKSDVYSLGLVFLYMASLKPPNDLTNLNGLDQMIKHRLSEIRESYPQLEKYLESMLEVHEEDRCDFKELSKEISSGRVSGHITSKNISEQIGGRKLTHIEAKCMHCTANANEDNLFIYNAAVLCTKCKDDIMKSIQKRDLYHYAGQLKHKLEGWSCKQCRINYCPYCKRNHEPKLPCNKVGHLNQVDYAYYSCPECASIPTLHEQTVFSYCENDHFYCHICQKAFNESLHELCKIAFTGFPAYPPS